MYQPHSKRLVGAGVARGDNRYLAVARPQSVTRRAGRPARRARLRESASSGSSADAQVTGDGNLSATADEAP
jgi:hypothetical protein